MTAALNPLRRHRAHCRQVREQLSDYLDGDIDTPSAVAVSRHLRICPNCRRMLAGLTRTVAGLHALRGVPAGGEGEREGARTLRVPVGAARQPARLRGHPASGW